MKKSVKWAAAAAMLASASMVQAEPSIFPTGTTIYNPAKAYSSYILFGGPDNIGHLIDMNGHDVHSWDRAGFPTEMLPPAPNGEKGHVLVQLENDKAPFGGIFSNRTIGEYDWNGKTVWSWGGEAPGGAARQNHDWARLPNGNTMIIATVIHVVPQVSPNPLADQELQEITPDGRIVWRWSVGDHIGEYGFTPEGMNLIRKVFANAPKGSGFLVVNDMQPLGPNKWFEGGDKRFDPDNIMIDSREGSFIAIIDRKTGHLAWRLGPDYAVVSQATSGSATIQTAAVRPVLDYKVPRPVDQTSGQHDAHIIPEGLPGAGNLLVFDNEGPSGYPPTRLPVLLGSRVLEINPVTKQIVWQYSALDSNTPVWNFYSSFISSARRLPNGNTLICEGMNGRMFQVTPAGEIVWEYVNPYFANQTMSNDRVVKTNWVFRAQPVAYDWVPAGLPHDETPVAPIDVSKLRIGNLTSK